MSRHFLVRLLETFFRRWPLYLSPLVVLLALGAYSVASSKPTYRSTGVLYADSETLLSRLTDVRANQSASYLTPAALTAEQMGGVVQTEDFIATVAEQADLATDLSDGTETVDSLRSALSVIPTGYNLVQVQATTNDAERSARLADATIAGFVDFVVEANLSDSTSAEEFFGELTERYEDEVAATRATLDTYLLEQPDPLVGERPAIQRSQIERLDARIASAETRYQGALDRLEDARLATAQTRDDVSQRLKVVDVPEAATSSQSSLKATALTLAAFAALGLVLSGAAVVGASLLDRSVRTQSDVNERLRSVVLAELPTAKAKPPFELVPVGGGSLR